MKVIGTLILSVFVIACGNNTESHSRQQTEAGSGDEPAPALPEEGTELSQGEINAIMTDIASREDTTTNFSSAGFEINGALYAVSQADTKGDGVNDSYWGFGYGCQVQSGVSYYGVGYLAVKDPNQQNGWNWISSYPAALTAAVRNDQKRGVKKICPANHTNFGGAIMISKAIANYYICNQRNDKDIYMMVHGGDTGAKTPLFKTGRKLSDLNISCR